MQVAECNKLCLTVSVDPEYDRKKNSCAKREVFEDLLNETGRLGRNSASY